MTTFVFTLTIVSWVFAIISTVNPFNGAALFTHGAFAIWGSVLMAGYWGWV